ncbi:hypothetical protein IHE45_03G093700 [Dioscorea alata]|uniref:Uncharacterized protein n=1 Tax=Dioscorea alata TaxID=55571 RepID=A0ACB7WMT0_DIOAL|nr:hypothetical protein IHE45_03G093700 [Dioscorea alata]
MMLEFSSNLGEISSLIGPKFRAWVDNSILPSNGDSKAYLALILSGMEEELQSLLFSESSVILRTSKVIIMRLVFLFHSVMVMPSCLTLQSNVTNGGMHLTGGILMPQFFIICYISLRVTITLVSSLCYS